MNNLGKTAVTVATIALLLLLCAGPGVRLGLWDFRFGFGLMRWAVYIGGASAVLALLLMLVPHTRRGQLRRLSLVLLVGIATALVPAVQLQKARSVPMIHDITTDLTHPPAFRAVLAQRADAPNPPEYQGEDVARQQREAYPDIQPLLAPIGVTAVFEHAVASARALGWEIVASEPATGVIEATDTTLWFGFKDDVVIRISAQGDVSRVDVRSKSRVGAGDVGANAARIQRFMTHMRHDMAHLL